VLGQTDTDHMHERSAGVARGGQLEIILHSMISFIVPAHNEQSCLGRTLQAIHDSARAVQRPYENHCGG